MRMNKKELEAFAKEAAKGIKTPEDLNEFSQMLKKITVEAALNAEMDEHLGYEKHQKSPSNNSRNGTSSKRVKPKRASLTLIHRATAMAPLSQSWSRNINPALPLWMTKSSGFTRKA